MATQQIKRRQIIDGIIDNSKVDASAAIASTKLADWSAERDANSHKLINLANGTNPNDAVNLAQVQTLISTSNAGITVLDEVRSASTANVSATYNATGGAGANGQFTGAPNSLAGVSLALNDRILLKNQTNQAANGIYIVSTVGSGSSGVWDRAEDFDEVESNSFVFVTAGTNANSNWVLTTPDPIVVGGSSGSDLTFVKFSAGSSYTADETSLTQVGSVFSVKDSGISTAKIANDAVISDKIADDAVTADHLATDSVYTGAIQNVAVTQAKIADNAINTAKLADASVSTVKIVDDAVTQDKIADSAVGSSQLASSSVTTAKIANGAVTGSKLSFLVQTVTGTPNDVLTAYTLSATPVAASLMVWINGLLQTQGVHYSFSGTTLTFVDPPETGDDIAVFGLVA